MILCRLQGVPARNSTSFWRRGVSKILNSINHSKYGICLHGLLKFFEKVALIFDQKARIYLKIHIGICARQPQPFHNLFLKRYSYINMARMPAIIPMKASILANQGLEEAAASECSTADVTDANMDPTLLAILPPVVVVAVAPFVIVELITITPVPLLVAVPLTTPVSLAAISSNCQLNHHIIRFSFEPPNLLPLLRKVLDSELSPRDHSHRYSYQPVLEGSKNSHSKHPGTLRSRESMLYLHSRVSVQGLLDMTFLIEG